MGVVGQRLQQLIKQHGLSYQELALISGVSRSLISQICNGGIENPRIDTLVTLAKALNTTVSFLAGETDVALPIKAAEWLDGPGADYAKIALEAFESQISVILLGEIVKHLKRANVLTPDEQEYLGVIQEAALKGITAGQIRALMRNINNS